MEMERIVDELYKDRDFLKSMQSSNMDEYIRQVENFEFEYNDIEHQHKLEKGRRRRLQEA